MKPTELSELMLQSAKDAVSYAQEDHQVTLDLSLESLPLVDVLLSSIAHQQQKQRMSDAHMFALCNIFGAYLGQVFLSVVGGQWVHQTGDETAPYVSLNYNNKEFPLASLVYHKVTKNPDLSVNDYVRQAISNAMQ
ncbi:hypothetical protein [Rheinheimera sp. F8]|uniref:hypothetical protein n=1 Tax=Rheinheimera sp. F8 TaxID=1763998 RepID=UPI0007448E0F|nr:hypothetical protein [Rheinheimera sp. F8]ALZ74463.1 hypothetical protein ATY27_00900 [Rheinheimera sp. F8]